MTDAERDAAWRLLPEDIRKEIRKGYNELKYYWHITADRRNGAMASYENIFGKHNLTASEEEKLRKTDIDGKFHCGDKVVTTACCPLYGKGWIGTVVQCHESDVDVAFGLSVVPHVALCDLAPYIEELEAKNGECVDFSSSSLQNRKNLTENDISSISKETAEELSNLLAEVNNFIERNQDSQVDWLAYRMELAKAIAIAYAEKGRFEPKDIAVNTMWVVDDIVRRLKGGEK